MRTFLISGLFLFLTLPTIGQGFSFVEEYSSNEVELENLQILSATQDTNGFIYFGTHLGIVAYDGLQWHEFHIGESGRAEVVNSTTYGLYTGGTEKFGEIKPDSLNNYSYSPLISKRDKLTTYYEVHEKFDHVIIRNFYGLDFISNREIKTVQKHGLSISFDIGDKILFDLYNDGLAYLSGTELEKIPGSEVLKDYPIRFAASINNKLVVGSEGFGFKKHIDNEFVDIFPEASNFAKEKELYSFKKLSDGRFILTTRKAGIAIMNQNGEIREVLGIKHGLPSNSVYSVIETEESILWIGTESGIAKSTMIKGLEKFELDEKIIGDIKDIDLMDSLVIVTTGKGVYSKKITSSSSDYDTISNKYDFSSIQKLDDKIILSGDPGLFLLDESGLIRLSELPINSLYQIGELIYAVSGEVVIELNKNLEITTTELPVYNPKVYKFRNFFFGSIGDRIFLILENQTLKELKIKSDLSDLTIQQLGQINNEFYVGTNSGLFLFDERRNVLIKDTTFFKDDKQVFLFEQCTPNEVWFNHNKEIKRAIFRDDSVSVISKAYKIVGEGKAIHKIICNGENIFFEGDKGLYKISDPDWEYETEFKTNITDIYVNRDSLIYGGFGEPVRPIVLPYEDNEVRFNYAAASYIDETRNTYSVKLEGFDNDWSEWSLETQKDYTNIPEGEYIFKVRSRNVYEVDGKPDQIAFTVLPPWYRTWWAYMLYFISFSGLLYSGYKIRVNQLLKVERMRTKIASDLHDEVSATLTGISYFAEAIKRDKDESKTAHFVSLISESAGDAKEKITDIVWSINPDNDSWELFLSKCRRFASDLLESKELEYTLKITEHIPGKLSMEIRQHLWMIFKEMVTNAVRHSKATRLDVIMDVENGTLKLIVQDNGIGFDLDEIREGNGVRNIKKRAAKIGATIKMHSEEDFGTRWRMELPL